MEYKKNFTGDFDLFMDRMSYVYEEYIKLMRWKQPDIGIWKTMGQYFMTFMIGFIEECKANWVDYTDRA